MSDDRGQLILVGAIAIAMVLLGLVLVVDTAMFTQVVGSEGTIEETREGGVGAQELGDSISAVVHEENLRTHPVGSVDSDVRAALDSDFDRMMVNRSLNAGGAFVSVEYLGNNRNGTVISQTDPRAFTNSTGVEDWSPVTNGEVGHFNLTIDTASGTSGQFDIVANPTTGPQRSLEVDVDNSANEVELVGAGTTAACSSIVAHGDTVRVDVRHGRVYENASCSFDLFGGDGPPHELQIDNGSDVNVTYTIVTNQTSSFSYGPYGGNPSSSDAIWSFEYRFTHDSDDATVESERREVDVYG